MAITVTSFQEALRIANAAGRDAAHKARRAGGREFWNQDDLQVAADVSGRILAALGYGIPETAIASRAHA